MGIALVVLLAAAVVLGSRSYISGTEEVAAYGGSYTEGLIGAPHFINPLLASTNDVDRDVSALVFSGLLKTAPDGSLIPDLAREYTVSEDQKEYTFTLKDNLLWHDGEPLTVDDIIFTIELIKDPQFRSPLRVSFGGVSISQLDEKTVVFNLKEQFPALLSALTVGIIPKHIWYSIPSAQAYLAEANIKPIGAGPYKFKNLTKDTNGGVRNITLARNEHYHGEKPFIDELTFKFYPDVETALDALRNKNIEGMGFLPLQYRDQLSDSRSIVIHSLDLPQHRAIFFNPETNEALKDKAVRKALAYAIDRERIVAEALQGNAIPLTGPILPGYMPDPKSAAPYAFDPVNALKLLDEAGWKTAEGSAMRKKGASDLAVKLTAVDQPENQTIAAIIKKNWEEIGVSTTVEMIPRQQIRKDVIEQRKYETLLFGQITTSAQDVFAFWHSSQTQHPGNNLSIFANKDIDGAVQDLRNVNDPTKQNELSATVAEKIASETYAIFLYEPTYLYPVHKKVRGIEQLQHVSSPSDRFAGIEEWYIKTRRQTK